MREMVVVEVEAGRSMGGLEGGGGAQQQFAAYVLNRVRS